ncbi:MAG: Bifunctional protein HldE [Sphingobacterium sp.]|jgi:D-beta-D-heptose 7-phosphate kinase/D-beta-D-heptose 1-phosphate adenosyltransferase|nr:Bifunctional protein HldE [Sphingobacterium sp.]
MMSNNFLSNFKNFSILVIGDLILDKYLQGVTTRINPEAPVPVVDILSETLRLGGAGNAAFNLKKLGAKVTFFSVIGNDENGRLAMDMLKSENIDGQLIVSDERATIVKTRVIAGSQVVVRYDQGTDSEVSREVEEKLISLICSNHENYDAILISDYNKGLLSGHFVLRLKKVQTVNRKFIAIDSKRLGFFKELSPDLVKPNYSELVSLLDLRSQNVERKKQISELGSNIYNSTHAFITAVTLDKEGSLIFEAGNYMYWCPPHKIEPHHTSGAGDTYMGAFLLSILSKIPIPQAAEIASTAARIGLEKKNTSFCTREELNAYLSLSEKFITNKSKLKDVCAYYRARGKKIVFTNGCFDVIHSGHVGFLNRSKEYGEILMIGINTDDSIQRLKGYKPLNSLKDRIDVLSSFGAVDHIVAFGNIENDTASELIEIIRPNVFTKGDNDKGSIPEANFVKDQNGQIVILTTSIHKSTKDLIQKIYQDPRVLNIN